MFSLKKVTKISILVVGFLVLCPNISMAKSEKITEAVEKPKKEEITEAVEKPKKVRIKRTKKVKVKHATKKQSKKKIVCTKGCHYPWKRKDYTLQDYCAACQHSPYDYGCGHFSNPCNTGIDKKTGIPFNKSPALCAGVHSPDPSYRPPYNQISIKCKWVPPPICGGDPQCHHDTGP